MSLNEDKRTRLLAETFHGDWSDGPAAEFARRAAHSARRLRRRRQTVLVASALTLVAFFALSRRAAAPPSAPGRLVPVVPAYEIISDDELLTTLHDRPLLVLPQGKGPRKIVVLAEAANS